MTLDSLRYPVVLYDFDGTLADSTELIMRCWRHTMAHHLGEVPADEEWLSGFGTPLETQIARFARSDAECDAMLDTYRGHQMVHHDTLLRPFAGAAEALDALLAMGARLAIVTSKHRELTLRGMDRCGIVERFEVVVTPEDVRHAKPHPEPVLTALERLGARADDAVFIGDSPHDLVAGRAAGTATAAALWGPFPRKALEREAPDHLLETPMEVVALVRGGSTPRPRRSGARSEG